MASAGARSTTGGVPANRYERGRSLAQWFCLIVGPTLILVGLLGFLAEAKFDTATGGDPGQLDGEDFIIFEVNGWHNVVHLASGLLLLVGAFRHAAAKSVALAFGVIYAAVAVIGLVDGKDIFDIVPVDREDNVLHIVLAVTALAVGLISTQDRERAGDVGRGEATGPVAGGGTGARRA